MAQRADLRFTDKTIDDLVIDDEASFRHVGLYADLKRILRRDRYRFRVLPDAAARWDRALFLSLTFWGADGGGDVLVDDHLPADVVAHVAWHHLAAKAFAGTPPSADALFLGEAIASAFDVYLIGRLLDHSPESSFLETQVPAMTDAAEAAGMEDADFAKLLQEISVDPDRAFEDLRQLLFDAATALVACPDAAHALVVLAGFDGHRFGALLHHFELSNWVLYARAYARDALTADAKVRAVDALLREQKSSVEWLASAWVAPALA